MTKGNTGKPKLSPLLAELLEQAWITSSVHHHETKIRSGALFEVFIASEQVISSNLLNILSSIKQEELKTEFYNILKGSVEDASVASEMLSAEEAKEIPADGTVLDLFTTNLTAQAKDGKIDPILGRMMKSFRLLKYYQGEKNPIRLFW